jgi:hypothetical protein
LNVLSFYWQTRRKAGLAGCVVRDDDDCGCDSATTFDCCCCCFDHLNVVADVAILLLIRQLVWNACVISGNIDFLLLFLCDLVTFYVEFVFDVLVKIASTAT